MTHRTADLAYWIQERHNIKERRESGMLRPWTADKIFQTVRFCNVHREDDRVTSWIRDYWNHGHDPAWRFVVARMLNRIQSLAAVRNCVSLVDMKQVLKDRRARGEKIFTSAYTISTCGKAMDKLDYVFDVIEEVRKHEAQLGEFEFSCCEGALDGLTMFDGLGSFLGAQVIADMKNTVGHPLAEAPDFWTFSAPGPGSLRGLSWYFHDKPTGVTASRYADALRLCRVEVDPLIPAAIPRISDQDFQNCLCEFSKYMKVAHDPLAHVRNKYRGVIS
jgi:hypothetical protein